MPDVSIEILQVYGHSHNRPIAPIQARGRVQGESEAYNIVARRILEVPRAILVRRSSWAARYGDGGDLPF